MSGPLQDAPRSSRIIRPRASVMECARPSAALASVAPGILDRSNRPCHLWARCGHWWESAKCLAHSKTLRAVRESSVHAPASWSAAALRRFGIGGTRHFRSQQPALPLVGAVRPLMGKRQRAGPLQDAPQSSRIIRPRASVMECARPSAALASVARGILDRSNRPCHCGRGAATDGKAPEGWRTPRRSAQFENHPSTRQRHGVRRPSAALASVAPGIVTVGAVRPLMGKRQRAGALQDAPRSSRIIRSRASVMECARPSAALASVAPAF
jgi:hypothetical protein